MRLALDTFGRKLIGRRVLISVAAHFEIMPFSISGGNKDTVIKLAVIPAALRASSPKRGRVLSTSAIPAHF